MSLVPLSRFSNGWHPVRRQPLSSRKTIAMRKNCGREVEATIDEPSLCIEEKPGDGGMVSKRSRCCKRFHRSSCEAKKIDSHQAAQARSSTLRPRPARLASIPIAALEYRHGVDAISRVCSGEKPGKKSRDATKLQAFGLQAIFPSESVPRLPSLGRDFGFFNKRQKQLSRNLDVADQFDQPGKNSRGGKRSNVRGKPG